MPDQRTIIQDDNDLNSTDCTAIRICTSMSCLRQGSQSIIAEFERLLDIKVGQTTPSGRSSLHTIRCVGVCASAPVVLVGEKLHSKVAVTDVASILETV